MEITVSYENGSEYGEESFESVSRYESFDFDKSVLELADSNTYIEYDESSVVSVEGSDMTLVVQHDKGDSTRYEDVTEVVKTSENLCIKKSSESNPIYLPNTNTILWITDN